MLQLGALHADVDHLRLRVLSWVSACTTSACEATPPHTVLGELERLLVGGDGRVEQLLLRVERAQLEIVLRQLGLDAQARGLQVAALACALA